METLIKSNDQIYISWIKSILKAHNIEHFTFDEEMSITEGNITAIPIRIIVNAVSYTHLTLPTTLQV